MFQINKKIFNFNSFLILLLPVSFVLGPLIVEIIVSLLLLQFLFYSFKSNNFSYFNNKIFFYFIIFYIFLLTTLLFTNYFSETYVNIIFYFRFIFFSIALYFFLIQDPDLLKKIYIFLSLTFLIVIFDGFWQFFFEENLLGHGKYRRDRISGFFRDDLILGSFLSRLLPLYLGIVLFFSKNKFLTISNLVIIFATIILIFLTGERAAFFKLIIFLSIIFFLIDLKFTTKLIIFLIILFSFSTFILFKPMIFDRYYYQTINQVFQKDEFNKIKIIPKNYLPMFETSLKMFEDNKLIGKGPKSYRYACKEDKFKAFFPKDKIENTKIKLMTSWKELRNYQVTKFFVSEGDVIDKGDKLFIYNWIGSDENETFFSDREGEITNIFYRDKYVKNTTIINVIPKYSPSIEYIQRNSCNTHPHNFYVQLLGETGSIGFIYIFILFLYLTFILIKNFFYIFYKNQKKLSNIELCIIAGFFVTLWPITTNGNFFNNWLNLINFYPLGILIYVQNYKKNKTK